MGDDNVGCRAESTTAPKVRCCFISSHIGSIQCQESLFARWGWQTDVFARFIHKKINHSLPYFIETDNIRRSRRQRLRLLRKWKLFSSLLLRKRSRYGEKNYVRILKLCYALRIIDERWYLVLLCSLPEWRLRPYGLTPPMRRGLEYIAVKRLMARYDVVITGYAPHFVELAAALGEMYDKRVVAISSHRYDQHKKDAPSLAKLDDCAKRLARMPKAIKAVNDDYDCHYEQHYLGITPHRLAARPMHVRPGIVSAAQDDTILLIGRSDEVFADFVRSYQDYCRANAIKTRYSLRGLREVHPRYQSADELRRHAAFLVFPYSAFAYSHFELYALNVPILIPSIRFVIENDIMFDRALPPTWCPEHLYKKMRNDIDAPDSPNSSHPDALRLWIGRGFLYRREHCIVFDDAQDLVAKLQQLEERRETIARGMAEENRRMDEDALKAWGTALRALRLPLPSDCAR